MEKARRKDLTRAYAERERHQGVFAVRCRPSGQVWVSASRNLDTQRNAVWFGLRTGGHPNRALQAAWQAHGEAAFDYEILEALSAEGLTPMGLADRLRERERAWREKLGAPAVAG
jgi:hypothetical protein